ncbi:M23 family metallopeptidase [Parvularcula sp. LCG005]|uniref:M23 family metallopeptidase n=1 Tax=Parvularcula sp. LCG005 TaxID=3078805 RepID=UPI002943D544|nr:M23 family metallopeptidase [Parvularcula sp. LCG005]WOI54527.1 M23 family metallopeptidase [Parvularcula sp. LCG005]
MRQSLLVISSLSIVGLAGAAIADAARAQEVPVTYRSDPGPAHPRYADERQIVGEAAEPARVAVNYTTSARTYSEERVYEATSRRAVTVEAGDTVYALSRRYGVPPVHIIEANNLSAPYALKIGQRVVIPGETIVSAPTRTPIVERDTRPVRANFRVEPDRLDTVYRVRPGDTLYSLSRQFGVDLQALADANDLRAPYSLAIDERIVIPGTDEGSDDAMLAARELDLPRRQNRAETSPYRKDDNRILVSKSAASSRFSWPLEGSVVMNFGTSDRGVKNDGINIAAPVGAPIRAAEDGEVIYTGSELAGYGNLLLIRHSDGWVSAYAHTDSIMVKKGDTVQQGQVVAKVGHSGSVDQPQLHFELRHELKPRDPLLALNGEDQDAREIAYRR